MSLVSFIIILTFLLESWSRSWVCSPSYARGKYILWYWRYFFKGDYFLFSRCCLLAFLSFLFSSFIRWGIASIAKMWSVSSKDTLTSERKKSWRKRSWGTFQGVLDITRLNLRKQREGEPGQSPAHNRLFPRRLMLITHMFRCAIFFCLVSLQLFLVPL